MALLAATKANTKDWRDLAPLAGWAKVISVYDGDTCWIAMDLANPNHYPTASSMPPNPINIKRINVRIAYIDTPEIKGGTEITKALARKARDHVRNLILDKIIWVEFGNFGLKNGESLDSFHRQIGKIYFRCENPITITSDDKIFHGGMEFINLGDHLLESGLANKFSVN